MKKIKILTITSVIILVTMVSFWGVYVHTQNRMENKVRKYSYAMDIAGTRNIRLKVSQKNKTVIKDSEGKKVSDTENLTDEQIAEKGYTKEEIANNDSSVLTAENYKKSKEIIEKRLQEINKENNKINNQFHLEENNFNYNIKMDETTGDIVVEIPENDNTDSIVSNLSTVGKFEIIDSQTNEVLMTNADIKLSNILYGSNPSNTTSNGTLVYLNIEFTKEGSKKLEDISNKYIKSKNTSNNTTNENAETEENNTETEKKVTMKIDDEEIMSTSFDETLKTGKLQLSIGTSSTDAKTIKEYAKQASNMATLLNNGNLPVKYEVEENEYILSDITNGTLKVIEYLIIAVVTIALIVLIIRYKLSGLLGSISFIGLTSIFLLVIRYTNVILSLEGMFAIALILILNYVFVNNFLLKLSKSGKNVWKITKETSKRYFIQLIPIIIAVIAFSFVNWAPIKSFGMVMFWGITLIAIYNMIVTNILLSIKTKK